MKELGAQLSYLFPLVTPNDRHYCK